MTPDLAPLCREVETLWRERIPLTQALGIRVTHFDGDLLEVAADLAPNVNVHGTAFAGSIYSISALCGWSMVHLQMRRREIDAAIVIAEGQISYLRPVAETIVARCQFGSHDAAWQRFDERGKARFILHSQVLADDKLAVSFEGNFGVRRND